MSDFVMLIALILGGAVLMTLVGVRVRDAVRRWDVPEPEDPPRNEAVIKPTDPPEERARKMMDEVEDFGERLRRRILIEVDDDEPQGDDEDDDL